MHPGFLAWDWHNCTLPCRLHSIGLKGAAARTETVKPQAVKQAVFLYQVELNTRVGHWEKQSGSTALGVGSAVSA